MADVVGASASGWAVREITAAETHPVRRAVLRSDTPTTDVEFVEDLLPGALHLGVVAAKRGLAGDHLIATSSWIERECPERPGFRAVQLRGMATMHDYRGLGIGAALVNAGCDHAQSLDAALVWANARDGALSFYEANGFEILSNGFVDPVTELAHHRVLRML